MKSVKCPLLTLAFLSGICGVATSQDSLSNKYVEELSHKSLRVVELYPDSIASYAAEGLELAKRNGNLALIAKFKKYLGIDAYLKGNPEKAIEFFTSAIEHNKILSKTNEHAACISDLAMVYSRLGDYARAVALHREALTIAEMGGRDEIVATIHNNLGIAYKDNGRLEESLHEYSIAIDLYSKIKDEEGLAGCLINAGNIELVRGEFARALQYFREALKLFESNKHLRGQATTLNSIADALMSTGKLDESLQFRERAFNLSVSKGFKSNEVMALTGAGELLAIRGQFGEALEYFERGISIARAIEAPKELLRLYIDASENYHKNGDPASALHYFRQYSTLKDSLFKLETESYLSNLRVLAEVSKKEAEIYNLQKDSRIARMSRNMILLVSSGLMAVLGLTIYALRQRRKGDRAEMEKQTLFHQANEERVHAELKLQKEREEELTRELDFRSRALTTYTLNLVQKNGMMEEIKSGIQEIIKGGSTHEHELKKLVRLVDYSYSLDKDWEGFKTYFEQVHPDFFKKIKEDYPQISTTELRLCALIRLSLSIKEAATILNIAPDSVKVARHRIRKKLNLSSDASITDFIMSI